jgi:hypothetical protein
MTTAIISKEQRFVNTINRELVKLPQNQQVNPQWLAIVFRQGIPQTPSGELVKIINDLVTIGTKRPVKLEKLLPQLVKSQRRLLKRYIQKGI